MREIASTSFKMFWGKTPRAPAKICPPHSQNAADALVRVCVCVEEELVVLRTSEAHHVVIPAAKVSWH